MSWCRGTRITEKWSAAIHHFIQPNNKGITSPDLVFHPSQLRSKLICFVAIASNKELQGRDDVGAKTRGVVVGGVKSLLCEGFRKELKHNNH